MLYAFTLYVYFFINAFTVWTVPIKKGLVYRPHLVKLVFKANVQSKDPECLAHPYNQF